MNENDGLKPSKTFVKLPGLLAFKIELQRADGERRTVGAYCRSDHDGIEKFQILFDGKEVGHGYLKIGHAAAIKMVKNMVAGLVTHKQHRTRNRLNRKARKAAAPVNPPLEVQPRPNLPEDDE